MSTELTQRPDNGVRTYRGRRLEDLIPQIRAELGPDAIILREREGLTGGVSGFFAQRCVEVDAQVGPLVDIYDDDEEDAVAVEGAAPPHLASDDSPPDFALTLREAEVGEAQEGEAIEIEPWGDEPVSETAGGTAQDGGPEPALAQALVESAPADGEPALAEPSPSFAEPSPAPAEPAPARRARSRSLLSARRFISEPPQTRSSQPAAGAVARELLSIGISEAWVHELIVGAAAHHAPFVAGADLREAVRAKLAASLPVCAPLPAERAAVAIVGAGGAGKTRCAAALAFAYRAGSTLPVSVVSLGGADRGKELKELLAGTEVPVSSCAHASKAARAISAAGQAGLVVIDTKAATPGDRLAVQALVSQLTACGVDAVYVAVPATLNAPAARRLLDSFADLSPAAIVVTHADETDQLGIAAELSRTSGVPLALIHEGLDLRRALSSAEPHLLAGRLLR